MLPAAPGENLRVYVVWLPRLRADSEMTVPGAVRSIADPRASHYWDPGLKFSTLVASTVTMPVPGPAWDMYLVYPAGARWDAKLPPPSFWMQQLKDGTATFLDPTRLATKLREEMAVGPR